jgi:hypothetical protein
VGDTEILLSFDKATMQLKTVGGSRYVIKNVVLTDQSRMSIFPQEDKQSHFPASQIIIDEPIAKDSIVIKKGAKMDTIKEKSIPTK